MSTTKRVLVAMTTLAVAATLAFVPGLGTSASAAGSTRTATAQCDSARASLTSAQQSRAKAKKKVVKKKKAVKKAKKASHKVKVKKAKKALKRAKKRLKRANADVSLRATVVSYACATPSGRIVAGSPDSVGQELNLLQGLLGGDALQLLAPEQLRSLLEALFPGVTELLDPDELAGLLAGFNAAGLPTPDDLFAMVGGALDRAQLEQLLAGATGGTVGGELIAAFAETILSQLSHLGGGLPLPAGGYDPASLITLISALNGELSPGLLGELIALLKDVLGQGGTLDEAKLVALLNGMVPGLADHFDTGPLAAMLATANGSVPGAQALDTMLGGFFTPAQLTQVLADPAAVQALTNQVVAAVVGQFVAAGGGDLPIPAQLDPSVLTGLFTQIDSLLEDVLGGILGGGGGVVCTLLPILC